MHLSAQPDVDQKEAARPDSCCSISDPRGTINLGSKTKGIKGWLLGPWPIAILFALCSLFLVTRNNDYPYYYEKDAYSKVDQVVTGHRNFYHPLLMLNTADAVLRITGMERTPQNAVMAGRWSIAVFAAVAIGALSILAFRLEGRAAAICVGALLTVHPLYFELAHFFKEDPALIVGLALSFLAMQVFWERRTPASAGFLGVAAAIAVSGKYVGVAALAMSVVLFICARRDEKQVVRWGAFLGAYIGVFCIINYQLVLNIDHFSQGFGTEINDLTRENKVEDIPHLAQSWKVLVKTLSATLALLVISQIIHHIRNHGSNPVRWLLFLYPIIFFNVLMWSPRLFTRHFLPVVTFLLVLAGMGIPLVTTWLLKITRKPRFLRLPLSLLILILIYRIDLKTEFRHQYRAFTNLTREILIEKINENIPKDAVIAADTRIYLVDREGNPRLTQPVEQKVITRKRLSMFGSLEELRKLGVTHVAAHGIDSRALFKPEADDADDENTESPENGSGKKGYRNPQFYQNLEKNAKLLWEIQVKGNSYITPELRFYELHPQGIVD